METLNAAQIIEKVQALIEVNHHVEAYDMISEGLIRHPVDITLISYCHLLETILLKEYAGSALSMLKVPSIDPAIVNKLTQLDLASHEGFLLTQIDGKTNVKSLIYICGLGKFTTLHLLHKFLTKHMIFLSS